MPTSAVTGTMHLHTTTENPIKMTTCSHCGHLRRGYDLAIADGRFYCHGITDEKPTCYQKAVLEKADD